MHLNYPIRKIIYIKIAIVYLPETTATLKKPSIKISEMYLLWTLEFKIDKINFGFSNFHLL
jgi:hypothetical protein